MHVPLTMLSEEDRTVLFGGAEKGPTEVWLTHKGNDTWLSEWRRVKAQGFEPGFAQFAVGMQTSPKGISSARADICSSLNVSGLLDPVDPAIKFEPKLGIVRSESVERWVRCLSIQIDGRHRSLNPIAWEKNGGEMRYNFQALDHVINGKNVSEHFTQSISVFLQADVDHRYSITLDKLMRCEAVSSFPWRYESFEYQKPDDKPIATGMELTFENVPMHFSGRGEHRKYDTGKNVGRALLTPFAVAGDIVTGALLVVTAPIWIPMALHSLGNLGPC